MSLLLTLLQIKQSLGLFSEIVLCLKPTIWLHIEDCCHVWLVFLIGDLLDKLHSQVSKSIGSILVFFVKPCCINEIVFSVGIFFSFFLSFHLNWLICLCFLILVGSSLAILIDCLIFRYFFVNILFCCTAKLLLYVPQKCFYLIYDLSGFKSRVNRHILYLGSF